MSVNLLHEAAMNYGMCLARFNNALKNRAPHGFETPILKNLLDAENNLRDAAVKYAEENENGQN